MSPSGKPPLVSVVIPTFNRVHLLSRALDAVLEQDYPAKEVIVVDDGSTDATADLLVGYGASIEVLRQANRGVSAARNRGIGHARGDLIALCDSDDVWRPGKLSRQVAWFASHPEMMICQTEEIWVRNGRRVNPKHRHRKFGGWIFEKCLPLCLISPSAVMVRAGLFDAVGLFDERLPACEDYDMWLRVTCRFPVGLIEAPLIVKHGGHADQLSRMPELDKYRIDALCRIIDSGRLDADQRTAAAAMLVQKCAIYAGGCRKRGRLGDAARYERLADRYRPEAAARQG